MAGLTKRFIAYDASIKCVAVASLFLRQLQEAGIDPGVEVREESNPNSTVRDSIVIASVSPKITLPTGDLSVLATIGMTGLNVVPASTKLGVILFGRNVPDGQLPDLVATTSHVQCAISDCLIIPVTLRASHNGKALLTLMLYAKQGQVATYSQATPMIFTTGAALIDAGTATPNDYTLGPVSVNGTVLTGIQDANVAFGIDAHPVGDSSNPYPQAIPIYGQKTVYEFTTNDLTFAATVGQGLVATGFVQYFRKYVAKGIVAADGAGSHVSFTHAAGLIKPGAVGIKNKTPGTAAYTFYPTDLATISTTDSIPTGA